MRFPLLIFIIVPIAEVLVLFEVAGMIGGLATLGLVICTAFIGLSVLRRQGFSTLRRVNQRLQAGQLPAQEIVSGMLLAFAGVLLVLPGLITDAVGLTLLIPALRGSLAGRLLRSGTGLFVNGFQSRGPFGGGFYRGPGAAGQHGSQGDGEIIEGEVVEKEPSGADRLSSRDPHDSNDPR